MNISGKTRIFKNELNGRILYSTAISNKNINGEYEKCYISVQLPKDTNIENGIDIEVTKGFIATYKDKNNLAKLKLVIQEFTQETNTQQQEIFITDELPF